jgi:hypothetical protein
MLDRNTLTGGIFLVALYIFVAQPLSTAFATVGISILLYAITKTEGIVLGFMLASLFIRDLNRLFIPRASDPVGVEAFQVRDGQSVHARIATVDTKKPLSPKVENITGVLESPDILDNTPLMAMDGSHGVPGASIPASARGMAHIKPVAEGFENAPLGSVEVNPMANPVLQNGVDNEAVDTSLFDKGTDMQADVSSDMDGVTTDSAV